MDTKFNISFQDLGNIYKFLDKAVVSGDDVAVVYNLKLKLIGILKAIEASTPKSETVTPDPTKVDGVTQVSETAKDTLDMK